MLTKWLHFKSNFHFFKHLRGVGSGKTSTSHTLETCLINNSSQLIIRKTQICACRCVHRRQTPPRSQSRCKDEKEKKLKDKKENKKIEAYSLSIPPWLHLTSFNFFFSKLVHRVILAGKGQIPSFSIIVRTVLALWPAHFFVIKEGCNPHYCCKYISLTIGPIDLKLVSLENTNLSKNPCLES